MNKNAQKPKHTTTNTGSRPASVFLSRPPPLLALPPFNFKQTLNVTFLPNSRPCDVCTPAPLTRARLMVNLLSAHF